MKSNFMLRLVGGSGVGFALALTTIAQEPADAPRASTLKPSLTQASAAAAAATDEAKPALTRAEAQEKVTFAKRYVAHPPKSDAEGKGAPLVSMPEFDIAVPPPAPRAEAKPDAPGAGYVWVAGHYMPEKGEWRWVRGEWAVPATPSSVWIAARYDEKEQKWSPGYWQPDVPTPADQAPAPGAAGVYAPAHSATPNTAPAAVPARR
jgi:hypothetical protein